jgi:hypothetical protein
MAMMHDAEAVVQRQLDAYNDRDLERLGACYAHTALLFRHPDELLASGIDEIRERMKSRLREPNLRARLLNRITMGSFVIDHEQVTRTFPEGSGTMELVAIYEVLDGKIARQWLIVGVVRLDAMDSRLGV